MEMFTRWVRPGLLIMNYLWVTDTNIGWASVQPETVRLQRQSDGYKLEMNVEQMSKFLDPTKFRCDKFENKIFKKVEKNF